MWQNKQCTVKKCYQSRKENAYLAVYLEYYNIFNAYIKSSSNSFNRFEEHTFHSKMLLTTGMTSDPKNDSVCFINYKGVKKAKKKKRKYLDNSPSKMIQNKANNYKQIITNK